MRQEFARISGLEACRRRYGELGGSNPIAGWARAPVDDYAYVFTLTRGRYFRMVTLPGVGHPSRCEEPVTWHGRWRAPITGCTGSMPAKSIPRDSGRRSCGVGVPDANRPPHGGLRGGQFGEVSARRGASHRCLTITLLVAVRRDG
jgi:hypothetical protein